MPTARIGDIDIAYDIRGDGPPLLAIMGLTGSRHHWKGFPDRFADRHRVITFDNRGVGETSAPPGPYTAAQMAADSLALLDHLGVENAVVFGVSMGGMIAQELALRAPERVVKSIFGCTHFGGGTALPPAPEVLMAFAGLGKERPEVSVRRLVEANFSMRFRAEHADVIDALVVHGVAHRMTPAGFKGQLAALAAHDTAARVGEIRSATLVLTGDHDLLIPVGNADLLAAAIPCASLVKLEGVGHMFWVEAADAAEATIRAFLGTK